MTESQKIARCLIRRHRQYADRNWLYLGMGWGGFLHKETRAWYLWRVASKTKNPLVRSVALALHANI
jgi:hypothetical protein